MAGKQKGGDHHQQDAFERMIDAAERGADRRRQGEVLFWRE
jgi:hypothetical protein